MTGRHESREPDGGGMPAVRIESTGVPAEEVAAATAVLTALLAGSQPEPVAPARQNGWGRSIRGMRTIARPGAGAWRSWL